MVAREREARLALLIDAENVSAKYLEPLFEELTKYGTIRAKRIYGDWTQPGLAKWRNALNQYSILPVQQFQLCAGKNSTDCALIIDAMDLLYSGHFDGFAIVSSDSDFTRLACRIRESGLTVYGVGERKTPDAFVKACDRFITLELLETDSVPAHEPSVAQERESRHRQQGDAGGAGNRKTNQAKVPAGKGSKSGKAVAGGKIPPAESVSPIASKLSDADIALLMSAYQATAGEEGWANLGPFGAQILKLSPSFDPRSFGCKRLGSFVEATSLFEIKKIQGVKNPVSSVWCIRLKS